MYRAHQIGLYFVRPESSSQFAALALTPSARAVVLDCANLRYRNQWLRIDA